MTKKREGKLDVPWSLGLNGIRLDSRLEVEYFKLFKDKDCIKQKCLDIWNSLAFGYWLM